MSKTRTTLNICIFLSVIITCAPAHAVEKLVFNHPVSTRLIRLIESFTLYKPDIARTDLNADGMEEFIVRSAGCERSVSPCLHQVLAEAQDNIIELGRINAKRVMLGNGYSHGIRDLFAFKNQNNDYDYDVYVWEPDRSQYILKE